MVRLATPWTKTDELDAGAAAAFGNRIVDLHCVSTYCSIDFPPGLGLKRLRHDPHSFFNIESEATAESRGFKTVVRRYANSIK